MLQMNVVMNVLNI